MNHIVITQTWLSKKPTSSAYYFTAFFGLILFTISMAFLSDTFGLTALLPASGELVFNHQQIWRAWTALFAHADLEHLLSNMLLLLPLTYFLTGHFGSWVLFLALLTGGITNLVVLKFMPAEATLIGISGVVYWMGACWLTLYTLLHTQKSLRRRLGQALVVALILFFPDKYNPNVSYLSHFLGFGMGLGSAILIFFFNRKKFKAAEIKFELIEEPEDDLQSETNNITPIEFERMRS